jgi:tocopherol cyclase
MRTQILPFALVLLMLLPFSIKLKSQQQLLPTDYKIGSEIPGYGFKKRRDPIIFQGNNKQKEYFEGWYFKMVSEDGSSVISIIPGISLSKDGKIQHAFIQLINGKTAETSYYPFPIEEFSFSKDDFAVRIGKNYFSRHFMILNIQNDSVSLHGRVEMSEKPYWPFNKKKKNIMGWYRHLPFMECYHGVVSESHNLKGSITKDSLKYVFDKGLGYIEKDWGKSMPSAWIWMQTNHFKSNNASFMLSVANIPWLGQSFTGFLGFFLLDSTRYQFGTYTGAKLTIDTTKTDTLEIIIINKDYTYYIEASRNNYGMLKAPVNGAMDRRIAESVDAMLKLKVLKGKEIIFDGSSSIAGLELVGDTKTLYR